MASLIKQTDAVLAKLVAKPDLAWAVGQALLHEKLIVGPWTFEDKKFTRKSLKGAIIGWVTTKGSFYDWYAVRGARTDKGQTPKLKDALEMVDQRLREDDRVMASSDMKLASDWYSHKSWSWERRDLVENIILAEINYHYGVPREDGQSQYEVVFDDCVGALCIVSTDVEVLKKHADEQLTKAGWTLTEEVGLG